MVFLDTSTVHSVSARPPVGLLGVLFVLFAVLGCSGDPSKNYTINVDYVFIEWPEDSVEGSTDYSSAAVTLSRVDVNESNEKVVNELSTSFLRNGKVVFRGQIESPMWVEVVAESDKTPRPVMATAYVEPGENISLSLIDYSNPLREDTLAHVGILSNVQNQDKKFVLSGDIGSLSKDYSNAVASLFVRGWDDLYLPSAFEEGSVVLQNGSFNVEMEFSDPVIVEVSITGGLGLHLWASLIAEPGVSVFLQPRSHVAHASPTLSTGWFQTSQDEQQRRYSFELVAVAGSGRHAKLLESWQQSFTYRLIREEMGKTWEEDAAMRFTDAADSDGVEGALKSPGSSWVNIDPTEGCEHIDLSLLLPQQYVRLNRRVGSRYEELLDEMISIRRNVLDDFARNAVDPMDSLLALELGALGSIHEGSTHEYEEKLQVYDRLTPLVPQKVVEERIDPARELLVAHLESARNESRMVPGQRAPDFELPDFNGTVVNFYEVLDKNNLVYIEFADEHGDYFLSEQLGELKEAYEGAGLQIIEILIGSDSKSKEDTSEEGNTKWIKLHESNGFTTSKLARTYATVFNYKNYLIDSNRCIVQSNFSSNALNEFLSAYFDISSGDE